MKEEFDELYPGEVEEVHLVRNTRELDPKAAEYKKTVQELTDLLDDYTSKRRRHKEIKRKKAGPWTSDVDGSPVRSRLFFVAEPYEVHPVWR